MRFGVRRLAVLPIVLVLVVVLVLDSAAWWRAGVENVDMRRNYFVVPKGLNEGSQAIYCLEWV